MAKNVRAEGPESLYPNKELCRLDPQHHRNPPQTVQCDIHTTPFEQTHVCPMEPAGISKGFLRYPLGHAQLPDTSPDLFLKGDGFIRFHITSVEFLSKNVYITCTDSILATSPTVG